MIIFKKTFDKDINMFVFKPLASEPCLAFSSDEDDETIVNCASCHKPIAFGDSYKSSEYYDANQKGLAVCKECSKAEDNQIKRETGLSDKQHSILERLEEYVDYGSTTSELEELRDDIMIEFLKAGQEQKKSEPKPEQKPENKTEQKKFEPELEQKQDGKIHIQFHIADSGNRRQFDSGAVRDCEEGKGRYDLLPMCTIMRLAKHFEKGCKKYGERNWEDGIPCSSYLDSAFRHLVKYADGWNDEDHLISAIWNLCCLAWNEENRPDLMNIPARYGKEYDNGESNSVR